mmetsp:Transcript_2312/g.5485  ORF Transcript_2312/g.5485 Transcript_2312/m.5485 type:complete len:254 (-) Transcript_2312:412-1173(-)
MYAAYVEAAMIVLRLVLLVTAAAREASYHKASEGSHLPLASPSEEKSKLALGLELYLNGQQFVENGFVADVRQTRLHAKVRLTTLNSSADEASVSAGLESSNRSASARQTGFQPTSTQAKSMSEMHVDEQEKEAAKLQQEDEQLRKQRSELQKEVQAQHKRLMVYKQNSHDAGNLTKIIMQLQKVADQDSDEENGSSPTSRPQATPRILATLSPEDPLLELLVAGLVVLVVITAAMAADRPHRASYHEHLLQV